MTQHNLPSSPPNEQLLREEATRLGLWGVLAHWDELAHEPGLGRVLACEAEERHSRSLARRLKNASIGRMKALADFDWDWPTEIDRDLVDDLFRFEFLEESANIIIVGPNGVGKSMIAQNLAYQAVLRGHTALFITASELLNDLASQEAGSGLVRRFRHYCRPQLLVIDEVGYLASASRHGDLLFELVTRRYQTKSIVLTTNKAFAEWNEVFPSSGCVVTLIDRLIHKAEIVQIQGESYRFKEAQERAKAKAKTRSRRKPK